MVYKVEIDVNTNETFVTFNTSSNKSNYSQRNNEYVFKAGQVNVNKNTVCNATVMTMILDYAGYSFPKDERYTQPEDSLTDFIMTSKEIDEAYRIKFPAMYKTYQRALAGGLSHAELKTSGYYPPNEIHRLLSMGANLWLGLEDKKATYFDTEVPIPKILDQILLKNLPVGISGCFNSLHHIVALVGAVYAFGVPIKWKDDEELYEICTSRKPASVIIDDPFGDMTKGYKVGTSGNDVKISWSRFIKEVKPLNNTAVKWAHFVNPAVATV